VAVVGGAEDCPEIISDPDWGWDGGRAVALGDGYAYLITREPYALEYDFRVIEVSPDGAMSRAAELPWFAEDLAVVGDYVYSACGDLGLWMIDVSEPGSPMTVGRVPESGGGYVSDLSVDRGRLYVAAHVGGLRVFDLANPADPVILGSIHEDAFEYQAVAASGDFAYVVVRTADGRGILQVIDVSSPWDAAVVGTVETAYRPDPGLEPAIVVHGHHAYVGGRGSLSAVLEVFDVRNPRAPRAVAQLLLGDEGYGMNLAVGRGRLYVVETGNEHYHHGTLWVIDIRDPSNPRVSAELENIDGVPTNSLDLVYSGGRLYLAGSNGPDGILMLDVRQCDHDYRIPDRDPDGVGVPSSE